MLSFPDVWASALITAWPCDSDWILAKCGIRRSDHPEYRGLRRDDRPRGHIEEFSRHARRAFLRLATPCDAHPRLGRASNGSTGGSAARVTGNLTVSPGDVLTVTVATGGVRPTITGVEVPLNATGGGGYGKGGDALLSASAAGTARNNNVSGSGGGSSAVVRGNVLVTIAAGGGGGGACHLGSSLQNGTVTSAGNGSARANVRRPGSIVISY